MRCPVREAGLLILFGGLGACAVDLGPKRVAAEAGAAGVTAGGSGEGGIGGLTGGSGVGGAGASGGTGGTGGANVGGASGHVGTGATGAGGVNAGGTAGNAGSAGVPNGNARHTCDAGAPMSWVRTFGDAADEASMLLEPDGEGGVFLLANFAGALDVGGGDLLSAGFRDLVVARLDSEGEHVWSRRLGTERDDVVPGREISMAHAPAGGVIVGYGSPTPVDLGDGPPAAFMERDSFVVSFDSEGNRRWAIWLPGTYVRGLAVDPTTAEVIVAGTFDDTVWFGPHQRTAVGSFDAAVVRLAETSGEVTRVQTFGSNGSDGTDAVAVTSTGELFVGGWVGGDIDFGTGPLSSISTRDAWVASMNRDLDVGWAKVYTGSGERDVRGVHVDPGGDLLVFGRLWNGTIDVGLGPVPAPPSWGGFATRLDPSDGGGLASTSWHGLAVAVDSFVDAVGKLVIGGPITIDFRYGSFVVPFTGVRDGMAIGLEPDLNPAWAFNVGNAHEDDLKGIAPGENLAVFGAGYFSGTLEVPGCPGVESRGGRDIFLLRRDP